MGCSSSSGSPMAFRAWTARFLYPFHKHLAHRILGQMDAGSDVLLCHPTQERIPMCWPTGLLQNSSRSFLQSHTKGVCSATLGFSPVLGGIHLIWLHMQTSCTITPPLQVEIHFSVCEAKFQGKMHPLLRWPPELRKLNCTLKELISLHWLQTTLDRQLSFKWLHCGCLWSERCLLCPFPFLQQPLFFLVCLVNISLMSRLGLFPFLSTWSLLFSARILYCPSTLVFNPFSHLHPLVQNCIIPFLLGFTFGSNKSVVV